MELLLPHQIRPVLKPNLQPEKEINPQDWILGAVERPSPEFVPNFKTDWRPYNPEFELQRNGLFDPYDCVSNAVWNKLQPLAKFRFNDLLNKSKRYTAKKSGTIPRRGNSVTNVVESVRKDGCVDEVDYPSMTETMTEDEFYQTIPQDVDAKENFKSSWDYNHEWLNGNTPPILKSGLVRSPVMVSVSGRYEFDSNGFVKQSNRDVDHEVVLMYPDEARGCWWALDSENPSGYVPFAWDYVFIGPKIGYLNKKKAMNNIYRKTGQKAIGLYVPDNGGILLFADGMDINGKIIAGGSVFKAAGWSYKDAQECIEWPYPIVGEFTSMPISN